MRTAYQVWHYGPGLLLVLSACHPQKSSLMPEPAAQPSGFVVNGVTGDATGRTKYPVRERVEVIVNDVNPFLFQYRVRLNQRTLTEASPADFFRVAFQLSLPDAPAAPPKSDEVIFFSVPDGQELEEISAACVSADMKPFEKATADASARLYGGEVLLLQQTSRDLNDKFTALREQFETYDASYRASADTIYNAEQPAENVKAAAASALKVVQSLRQTLEPRTRALKGEVAAMSARVDGLGKALTPLPQQYPYCTSFPRLLMNLRALASDTLRYNELVKQLEERRTQAQTVAEGLTLVLTDPTRFRVKRQMPTFETSTDVTVIVERRTLAAKDTLYRVLAEERINFGGRPRFAIGAGIAWSPLGVREYGVVQRPVAAFPGQPADTLQRVIVATEASSSRLLPMVTLTTRLFSLPGWVDGGHVLLGTGIRTQGSTDVDFLLAYGMSAFNQRLMLSVGAFAGKRKELAGDYVLGDRLPGAASTVATRSELAWEIGWGLSYRIR